MRSVLVSLLSLTIVAAASAQTAVKNDASIGPRRLLERDDLLICSLASDETKLYFVTATRPEKPTQTGVELWVMPKSGGAPKQVFRVPTLQSAPALDGGYAYFIGQGGAVQRASLTGGPPTTLVEPRRLAALIRSVRDSADPELTPCAIPSAGLPRLARTVVVDRDAVFWLDVPHAALLRVSKQGGNPLVLARRLPLTAASAHLARAGDFLYFTTREPDGDRLMRIAKQGSGKATEVARLSPGSGPFVVGPAGVAWANDDELIGLSDLAGRSFRRALPPSQTAGFWTAPVCDLAVDGETFVLSRCSHPGDGSVFSVSGPRRDHRVLVSRRASPVHLIADGDSVYFVEIGQKAPAQSAVDRSDCCSIWSAPR